MMNNQQASFSSLAENEVHIWHLSLKDVMPYQKQLLPLLTQEEQSKYQRASQHQAHPPQLASRGLLRCLLARYLNISAENVHITRGEHGKPALTDFPWLQWSLSHTKTDIVFAINKSSRIGVDLENARNVEDYMDLAERFYSSAEYQYLLNLADRKRKSAFIQLWVLKEAFVKAVGFGLSYPLSDFSIAFQENKPYIANKACVKESSQASDWHCELWPFQEGELALVLEGPEKTVYFDTLQLDAVL